jgi:hypothetical protein
MLDNVNQEEGETKQEKDEGSTAVHPISVGLADGIVIVIVIDDDDDYVLSWEYSQDVLSWKRLSKGHSRFVII